jgi:hypothetical protein
MQNSQQARRENLRQYFRKRENSLPVDQTESNLFCNKKGSLMKTVVWAVSLLAFLSPLTAMAEPAHDASQQMLKSTKPTVCGKRIQNPL